MSVVCLLFCMRAWFTQVMASLAAAKSAPGAADPGAAAANAAPCDAAAGTVEMQRDCDGETAHASAGSPAAPGYSAAVAGPSPCAGAGAPAPLTAQAGSLVQGCGAVPAEQRHAAADAKVGTLDAAAPAAPGELAQPAPPVRPRSDSSNDAASDAPSSCQAGSPAAAQRLLPVGITTFTEARAACLPYCELAHLCTFKCKVLPLLLA